MHAFLDIFGLIKGRHHCSCLMLMVVLLCLGIGYAPKVAWAEALYSAEGEGPIPKGVLTTCNDPFSVDAVNNIERVSQSEETETIEVDNANSLDWGMDFTGEIGVANIPEGSFVQSQTSADEYEKGVVLATISNDATFADLERCLSDLEGVSLADLEIGQQNDGVYRIRISDELGIEQAIRSLNVVDCIEVVQPNYIYMCSEIDGQTASNDPYAKYQWELSSVNASSAWDLVKTNGSVSVAVIDTGADLDHPDLAQNIVAEYNALSNSNTVEDQLGHGTHVAGIIAGVADNKKGVAGVSYNAGLVIIKATPFKSNSFDTAAIVRAYSWLESKDSSGMTVAEHYNVRVVNLSVGGLDKTRSSNSRDDILINAILKARDEFGILTVCAAGNGGLGPFAAYPGDSDGCISVMNLKPEKDETNSTNGVSLNETSNYNFVGDTSKDICAPGTSIRSAWLNGGYSVSSGTSMAAPIVSGVAALLFAANPTLTPQACMGVLCNSAIDLGDEGWDERYGFGEINAAAAVDMVNGACVRGWDVIGVGELAQYYAKLGWGMAVNAEGWSWGVKQGGGNASIDGAGLLTGRAEGDAMIVATCTATTGAQISATKTVYVVDAVIVGDDALSVGNASSVYSTDDSRWTWVWKVEEGTGSAHIDQDAILHADRVGTVYVTATCTSNTNIVLRKKVVIEA